MSDPAVLLYSGVKMPLSRFQSDDRLTEAQKALIRNSVFAYIVQTYGPYLYRWGNNYDNLSQEFVNDPFLQLVEIVSRSWILPEDSNYSNEVESSISGGVEALCKLIELLPREYDVAISFSVEDFGAMKESLSAVFAIEHVRDNDAVLSIAMHFREQALVLRQLLRDAEVGLAISDPKISYLALDEQLENDDLYCRIKAAQNIEVVDHSNGSAARQVQRALLDESRHVVLSAALSLTRVYPISVEDRMRLFKKVYQYAERNYRGLEGDVRREIALLEEDLCSREYYVRCCAIKRLAEVAISVDQEQLKYLFGVALNDKNAFVRITALSTLLDVEAYIDVDTLHNWIQEALYDLTYSEVDIEAAFVLSEMDNSRFSVKQKERHESLLELTAAVRYDIHSEADQLIALPMGPNSDQLMDILLRKASPSNATYVEIRGVLLALHSLPKFMSGAELSQVIGNLLQNRFSSVKNQAASLALDIIAKAPEVGVDMYRALTSSYPEAIPSELIGEAYTRYRLIPSREVKKCLGESRDELSVTLGRVIFGERIPFRFENRASDALWIRSELESVMHRSLVAGH